VKILRPSRFLIDEGASRRQLSGLSIASIKRVRKDAMARKLSNEVKEIVKVGMTVTGGAGVGLGITGADTGVLAGAWGVMMYKIARSHGVVLDKSACIKTSAAIVASLSGYKLGCMILTHAVNALLAVCTLGASLVLALGINGIINALVTYRLGCLFDKLYGDDGCETAALTLGVEVLKSMFHIPSRDEFNAFMELMK